MSTEKYHPALIAIHWLVAIMLLTALGMGTFVLSELDNADPEKINALKGHMIFGVLLATLTIVRLIVRIKTPKPAHLSSGNAFLDKLSIGVHHSFYLFVILMAMSGMATALIAGIPDVVFGSAAGPLPDAEDVGLFAVHETVAGILMLLVGLHVSGAIYHQLILKDNLISRMKFSKK